jgi:hypothetical protein
MHKEFVSHLTKSSVHHSRLADHHDGMADLHKSRAESLADNGDLSGSKHHKGMAAIHKATAATHRVHAAHAQELAHEIDMRSGDNADEGTKVFVGEPDLQKLFAITD